MNNYDVVRKFIHDNPRIARDVISRMYADDEKAKNDLLYDFSLWARPEQIFDINPKKYNTVLLLCGRGWGKSHWLSNHINHTALNNPGIRIGLMAPTHKVLKNVSFLGDSGLINNLHPDVLLDTKFEFNKSDLNITYPNGSILTSYSAESYDRTRGEQTHVFYTEETAAWMYDKEAFEACRLVNRLDYKGRRPMMYIATTPRPTKLIKDLASDPETLLVKGITEHNYFLSPDYIETLRKKLTDRMFRQECLAEILSDNIYALFKMSDIEQYRVDNYPPLKRIIVAIDPAASSNEDSDETGIIVAGLGHDRHCYILEDATCTAATPEEWSRVAVNMYRKWSADRIVAEKNQGGDMVRSVIRSADRSLPPCKLVHASKGKEIRAEPVSAYYEHGEVHHVGRFVELERQMTEWNPVNGKSPDRLDALVWACTELMDKAPASGRVSFG